MENESCVLLIKDIEMGQLRCLKFIKAPAHCWVYFCLGVYLLMLKTRIKVTFNIEDRTIESIMCLSQDNSFDLYWLFIMSFTHFDIMRMACKKGILKICLDKQVLPRTFLSVHKIMDI